MLKVIRKLLEKIINDIDAGNSNVTESEALQIVEYLTSLTNKEERLSKYQACQYLNLSRASFDNYVKSGKIPEGIKQVGFKEKFWTKKNLDIFKLSRKKK